MKINWLVRLVTKKHIDSNLFGEYYDEYYSQCQSKIKKDHLLISKSEYIESIDKIIYNYQYEKSESEYYCDRLLAYLFMNKKIEGYDEVRNIVLNHFREEEEVDINKMIELLIYELRLRILENTAYDVYTARLLLLSIYIGVINYYGGKVTYQAYIKSFSIEDIPYSKKYKEKCKELVKYAIESIDVSNDNLFTYNGLALLAEKYLLRSPSNEYVETPQLMYMRCAISLIINDDKKFTEDKEECLSTLKKYYTLLSTHRLSLATPILYNIGLDGRRGSMISCVLIMNKEDSLEGINSTLSVVSKMSSQCAGIGIYPALRSKYSTIQGSNRYASGLIKYMKILNEYCRFFNQGGIRKGAIAVYTQDWDLDVFDLLESRLSIGVNEMRTRDIFTALWISDEFIERLRKGEDWTLFSHKDVIELAKEPYRYKKLFDVYGREFSTTYKKMELLAREGKIISKKVNTEEYWDSMIKSHIESGTPYMLFKDTINRSSNQKNIGTIKQSNLCLAGNNKVTIRYENYNHSYVIDTLDIVTLWRMYDVKKKKFYINYQYRENVKILSYDHQTGKNKYCDITNIFVSKKTKDVVILKSTKRKVECTPDHKLYIKKEGSENYEYIEARKVTKGDLCFMEDAYSNVIGNIIKKRYITDEAVFDLTINETSNFFVNGMLVHNCSEIVQYTDPDTVATCTLASIGLPNLVIKKRKLTDGFIKEEEDIENYISIKKLKECVCYAVRGLNKIINLNEYTIKEVKKGALEQRAIGIGIQGLADVYAILKIPFTSPFAKKMNKILAEYIYFYALEESSDLAKLHGSYPFFENSPLSKGEFHFDMIKDFNYNELHIDRNEWDRLRKKIKEQGVMNSLLIANMPTCSTSTLLGNSETFEPYFSLIHVKKSISGYTNVINRYLVEDLEAINCWNTKIRNSIIKNRGSIQNVAIEDYQSPTNETENILEKIERLKEIYKVVFELDQYNLIQMAADRQKFIDQSQSMNVYVKDDIYNEFTKILLYGHKLGLKTGSYYFRTQSKNTAFKGLGIMQEEEKNNDIQCEGCSS